MYACIRGTGRGFFEGVCTPSNATAHSCDPPYPVTGKNRSPGNGTPARSRSRQEFVNVVVVAILDAGADTATPRSPLPIADPA
jgi:hypothetical protein